MSNNRIKAWEEIAKLAQLQELRRLLLKGNPCYGEKSVEDAAPYVVKRCPQIDELDGKSVLASTRKAAEELE